MKYETGGRILSIEGSPAQEGQNIGSPACKPGGWLPNNISGASTVTPIEYFRNYAPQGEDLPRQ
jgi:hypothetical protein